MKILFFVAALIIIGLVVTGAITLSRSADQTITIQIDKGRVKQDAAAALEKGKQVIEGAQSAIREAARDTDKN
jgi:hypothetical protein